ncbi:condensation domain-containing protein, partial [Pseudophaeobacter sp.]|uniref:condensation domain-containing protein n=1 Tax=Pseudophaeobacter sp. TaxID=1971739 RepID=UPI004059CF76
MNERFNPKKGAAAITSLPCSLEHLLDQLWPFLSLETEAGQAREIEPDDNLLELGLDSLKVMELAGRWRKLGAKVSFAKLISAPTAAQWLALCQELRQAPTAEAETETIAAEPVEDATPDQPFELSDVQYAYWVGRRDDQVMGGNGCHAYLELDGHNVEPQRLQAAWAQLLARHDMLRAQFHEDGTQTIRAAEEAFTLPVHDLRALSGAACANRLEEIRDRLDHRRLDVACGQVTGLELSLLPEGATRLHFDIDLLVADVHSLSIVLRDLALLYSGDDLPDLSCHGGFRQALARRKVELESQRAVDCAYWDAAFADDVEQPKIPLAVAPGTIDKPIFSRRKHLLRPEQWSALKSMAARHQVTPAMVLAKAFSQVLSRWSGQEGFVLNLPLFSRDTAEAGLQHVVGDFTDLLLLRTEVDVEVKSVGGQISFAQGVRDLQARFHQDMQHSAYSAVQIQRDLAAKHGLGSMRAPIVFASNLGTPLVDDHCSATLGVLGHMISQTPGVWLDHQIYEEQERLSLCWDVVEDLFPAGVIDGMFAAYVGLLDRLCGDEAQWDRAVALELPAAQ